jgi:hypothetical protein
MATQRSMAAPWTAAAVMLALCAVLQAGLAQARPPEAGQDQVQSSAANEQSAATARQARKTEQATRAAAVEDETSTAAQAARTAQSETAQFEAQSRRSGAGTGAAAPSYGPMLAPRSQGARDPARKDPAEVHDDTESLARPAPTNPADSQRRTTNPNLRRPAWQPAAAPMAPRPLRAADAGASAAAALPPVPVPSQAMPPGPVRPTRSVIVGCQGNSCTDTSGRRYNGIGTGNAGVSSSGRLCTRSGVSVQCF